MALDALTERQSWILKSRSRVAGLPPLWLWYVFFYGLLANFPFWAASRWLGLLPLGWFCTEYAVVGACALYLPRFAGPFLLLLAIAADLTGAASKTYYLTPAECLLNAGAMFEMPAGRLGLLACVLLLLAAVVVVPIQLRWSKLDVGSRLRAACALLAFAFFASSIDYLQAVRELGRFPNPLRMPRPSDTDKDIGTNSLWMGRYPVVRLIRDQANFNFARRHAEFSNIPSVRSAASAALGFVNSLGSGASPESPNVVLVIVESWGFDRDASVRNALISAYSQPELLRRYQVLQGTVPVYGATLEGEARELCGSLIGSRIRYASAAQLRGCLPATLAARGYDGIALHGMDGGLFDRKHWYGTIGFKESWFRSDFRGAGLPDCPGAFIGTCDASIAEWLGRRLENRAPRPLFAYWMTLNSHLPVPDLSSLGNLASCTSSPVLESSPAFCTWYRLIDNVHRSVAAIAEENLARPTIFIVAGDHAPPFSNYGLRNRFPSDYVPYVVLIPRMENDGRSPAPH